MSTPSTPSPSLPPHGGGEEEAAIVVQERARAVTELEHAIRWLCYREQLEDRAKHSVLKLVPGSARENERRLLAEQTQNRILAEARVNAARRELYRMLGVPELGA